MRGLLFRDKRPVEQLRPVTLGDWIGAARPRTLPLAIWDFQGQYASNIPAILSVVTLTSLPLIVAYAFGQERIVKGMMAGALKG